ncbi:MFS transporter [Leifsonia sp. Root112D2]|uniref:MFS transporter n=1 Tax=Leifsonia sp. Root112D2 TaxID=1736426 RepID=UPI0006FE308B|nr:MFS transporter [Leifsonia sp. Root112D2]KQV07273.1 MFS transporter [Leifsonia sp. Root112D2]
MSLTENSVVKKAQRFPWTGLLVLAGAVFLSVTSEMLPTGLLPDMSESLGASQSQIGLLVTVFAFTVVVTSTPVSALTRRWPRRNLMVAIVLVLALSNLLTAISPNYAVVVGTRILGGIAHGVFWAVVGAYAGHLVPREQIGRAVSITLGGGTLAFVFGVPLGTALGHIFGWRLTFASVGLLMIVAGMLVWRFLPGVTHNDGPSTDAATGERPRRDPTVFAVILVCVVTAIIMTGHYTFYTFIAPFMIQSMHVDRGDVGVVLFAYGIAGAIGLALAGSVLGRRPQLGLIIVIVVSALAIAAVAVFAAQPLLGMASLMLWGLAFGALPPLLQTRLLHTSSAAFRDVASAIYTTGFNVGIGGGALLGAVLYDVSGVRDLPWVYLGILVVALALVLMIGARKRRPA